MCVSALCQLSIFHTAGEGPGGTLGAGTRHEAASCGLLVLPQEVLPALTLST